MEGIGDDSEFRDEIKIKRNKLLYGNSDDFDILGNLHMNNDDNIILRGLIEMRTYWVKCVLIFTIMFVSAYVLSKTLLVDHVDYIETQRKQIAFLTILIQHQGSELRKEAPDMIARMIQKYDQQYKNLQNEVFGFAELTSSACFFLCILLSARPFQIHKKWLFLWRGRDWRFKSLLLSFAMIAIALVLSLACYCGVVFVLKWLLSTLLWCQMPFENGIDVIIQLSQVVEAFDQILLFSKWLNVAYCLQALSVVFTASVLVLLKIDCSDFFKSKGCDDNGNPCPINDGTANPPKPGGLDCCKDK